MTKLKIPKLKQKISIMRGEEGNNFAFIARRVE